MTPAERRVDRITERPDGSLVNEGAMDRFVGGWQPHAHPLPDPELPPDRARNDVAACALAVIVLLVLAFLAGVMPSVPQ
jgi:hypothetical protein